MLTIYKASAGSGKTYTLAYEYIKLLLGRKVITDGKESYVLNVGRDAIQRPHSRILAITFTNKATAEMKTRILKELNALTRIPEPGEKDAGYAKKLTDEFGCSREDLRDAAVDALRAILNDYGAFNISTIDSFFQSVLRSFAREIDRQGDFRVELDGDMAVAQSLSLLFDEINLNPDVADNLEIIKWLKQESCDRISEGDDFNPFNRRSAMYRDILNRITGIFNESFAARENDLKAYMNHPSALGDFIAWAKNEIAGLKAREDKATADVCASRLPTKKDASNFITKVVNAGGMTAELFATFIDPPKYINAMRDRNVPEMYTKTAGYTPSEAELDALMAWYNTINDCFPRRHALDLIVSRINTLWAIFHIYRFMEKYRQENNLILIADSNSLLKTIIDGSDTPFIYERVGMTLENYLIDEFQDTSLMQWENLRPLVTSDIDNADSLIIGDEKQSIYRFRGANPDILATQIESQFHNPAVKGAAPGENSNYRSAPDIVRFNNTLFYDFAKESSPMPPGYAGVAQALPDKTKGLSAWIRINDLSNKDFTETARQLLPAETIEKMVESNTFNPQEVALKIMVETIFIQLSRGYRQSDIAILVTKNTDGTKIAEYISRNYSVASPDRPAIRVVSEDSLLLRNSSAVKLIVSILEIIDRSLEIPADTGDSMRDAVYKSTLFDSDEDRETLLSNYIRRRQRAALTDSFEFYHSDGSNIERALDRALEAAERVRIKSEYMSDIAKTLEDIRKDAPANISALVQAIISKKINPDVCREQLPFITAFVDIVDEFMQSNTASIHSFLAYWNDNKHKFSVTPGKNEDALTISTVHKAKGLEWDCVHIPLLNWELNSLPEEEWYATDDLGCPEGIVPPPIIYLNSNKIFGRPSSPFKKQFDNECLHERIDNLNVAYVAFTRAARELHVNIVPNRNAKVNTGSEVLRIIKSASTVPNPSDIYMDFAPNLTGFGFEFGKATDFIKKEEDKDKPTTVAPPSFNVNFGSLSKSLSRISHFIADPFSADGDIQLDDKTPESHKSDKKIGKITEKMKIAARRGTLLHAILSQMRTFNDLDEALEMYSADLTPEELQQFSDILHNAFDNPLPEVTKWFDPANLRVLTEPTILCRSKIEEPVRADRIVWLPDGSVEVIDYKFTDATHDEHITQVSQYAEALRNMGYDVRAAIWYPLLSSITHL